MKNNNVSHKPDGLAELEEFHKDLLSISLGANPKVTLQMLNNLIIKVEMLIKKLMHKPRLPLKQIEEKVIEVCKEDKSTHGVIIELLFTTKFVDIDTSRLSRLIVKV